MLALCLCVLLHLPPSTCFALPQLRQLAEATKSVKHNANLQNIRGGSANRGELVSLKASNGGSVNAGDTNPPPQPTLKDLYKFALPCLGLWISGPLLSLVDTASVGLTAKPGMGAFELGALGPATTFIDGSTYLFAFLNTATTNLYASSLARNTGDEKRSKLASDAVVRTAAKISLFCGFGIMSLLFWKGEFLLSLYVGAEAAKNILEPATKYVLIRALSMPTALLAGVVQSALLGAKDSVTPLIAVAASTIVNIIGDGGLVVGLKMGSTGAAIATLLAQWAGTIAMFRPAIKKLLVKSTQEEKEEHKVTSKSFLAFAAPVLTLVLGKIAAFGMMTHVAASLPVETAGTAALASHQIVLSLFFFVSPFLEVISQTAQTFLPQYYVEDTPVFRSEAQALATRLLRLGICVGGGVALVAASIPRFFPFILTNDAIVRSSVKPLALPLFLASLLTAPVAVSEGILLARRELKFLASVYTLSTIAFPFGLFKLKTSGGPVSNVWYGFVLFQLFRGLFFTSKLWGRQLINNVVKILGMKKKETGAIA